MEIRSLLKEPVASSSIGHSLSDLSTSYADICIQKFHEIAGVRILTSHGWKHLEIRELMDGDPLQFFDLYTAFLGNDLINDPINKLRFSLKEMPQMVHISRSDPRAFRDFRDNVYQLFRNRLHENASLDSFEITVQAVMSDPAPIDSVVTGPPVQQPPYTTSPLVAQSQTVPTSWDTPEILNVTFRFQTQEQEFSPLYRLGSRLSMTSEEFFSELAKGSDRYPHQLAVHIKDTLPDPKKRLIRRGNEAEFTDLKNDISHCLTQTMTYSREPMAFTVVFAWA
jgi:hypothetical protein